MATDSVDELLDPHRFPTRESVEDHLLSRLLPVAYRRRPGEPDPPFSLERAKSSLGYIAYRMHLDNTRDLAWWHLPHWMPAWRRLFTTGLASGLVSGCLFAVVGGLESRPVVGLAVGLFIGLVAAVFNGLFVSREQVGVRRWMGLLIGSAFALGSSWVGLTAGVLQEGIDDGAVPGALGGLACGVGIGLTPVLLAVRRMGFNSRPAAAADRTLSPAASWGQDRRQSRVFGLLLSLTFGSTLGVVTVLVSESTTKAIGITTLALVLSPMFATMLSARARTTLAVLQLWPVCRCPVRLIQFLEDARERHVLRSAGPMYQFRHARLQDVLARSYADARNLPLRAGDPPTDG
jgi:hypothetical protein